LALKAHPGQSYLSDVYYHTALAYCNLEMWEDSIYPLTRCIELVPSDIRYYHE